MTYYFMSKYNLIFDFDGTIADTFSPTVKLLEKDFRQWGDRFNKAETIKDLRSLSIGEIIQTIPGGWWKFTYLLLKTKRKIKKMMPKIEAYPGIIYTLRSLHENGYPLFIVTSNEVANVKKFLHRYNLDNVFISVISTKGLFKKARTLKKVLKKYQLPLKKTFYIGDEIRDIQACKKINLKIISVSYGFNSEAGLQRHRPNYLVKKPTNLLSLLENLND